MKMIEFLLPALLNIPGNLLIEIESFMIRVKEEEEEEEDLLEMSSFNNSLKHMLDAR
jgi:hypothetical protein